MSTGPTDKQVVFALALLDKAGYDTRYMNASFSKLGATMRQRSGTVENWLRGMPRTQVSSLIDQLRKETA